MMRGAALVTLLLISLPAGASAQAATPAVGAVTSIPVRLVNKGLLPVSVGIAGNVIRVGPFSHAYVGFPAGTEIRRHARSGRGKLIHVIRVGDRGRDIRVG